MHNDHITMLLDLPDLIIMDCVQQEDKYIFIVKAKDESAICPDCGTHTDKVHDRRWQNIKDQPIRDMKVILRLDKKRYRCPNCSKRGFFQSYDNIDQYARKTKRYEKYLADQAISRDYSRVARENNLSYTSIENAVRKHIDPIIESWTSQVGDLEVISIDEFAVLKYHKYAVAITDPKRKVIIDILPTRKKEDLIAYFKKWPVEQLKKIKVFSMDMWKPYKAVADSIFPNAEIVVDKFHLVAQMNKALDETRQQVQNQMDKSTRTKFYKSRMLMKKRGEDLTDKEHQRLLYLFELSPTLERVWELKEEFRDFLQLEDINEATDALRRWYQRVSESKITFFMKAKRTIKSWEEKILNYFNNKVTNGFAEGINNKIKLIKRIGYGVPNIKNLRRRIFHAML
ncbi:MAG: ISL3 family transposase [Halanaerobiales bacterium]|nr:ISL3 family transposase [Halanaerobiales bacterium]